MRTFAQRLRNREDLLRSGLAQPLDLTALDRAIPGNDTAKAGKKRGKEQQKLQDKGPVTANGRANAAPGHGDDIITPMPFVQ